MEAVVYTGIHMRCVGLAMFLQRRLVALLMRSNRERLLVLLVLLAAAQLGAALALAVRAVLGLRAPILAGLEGEVVLVRRVAHGGRQHVLRLTKQTPSEKGATTRTVAGIDRNCK